MFMELDVEGMGHGETEIFASGYLDAKTIALVRNPKGQSEAAHEAWVNLFVEAPAMLDAMRNAVEMWRRGEVIGHNAPEAAAIRLLVNRLDGFGAAIESTND